MIESKLNDLTFFLPESWEEVKYNQYTEIAATRQNEELSGMEKAAQITSILTHIPLTTLQEAGIDAIVKLFDKLKFLTSEPEVKEISQVTINNTTYYAQKLTKFGELAAFDKADTAFQANPIEKLPFILAILLRKGITVEEKPAKNSLLNRILGKKQVEKEPEILYEAYPNDDIWLKKRADLFDFSLNPIQVKGLAAFFLSNGQRLQPTTLFYSEKEALIMKLKESFQIISELNTSGKPLFRICKKMLLSIGKYLIQKLERY